LIGEAGVEVFEGNTFRVRAVGFYRHTKDAIVYTSNPTTFAAKYLNASKQINYGAELEANYTVGKLTLTANYTFTDGETTSAFDGTGAPIGKDTTYYNLYRIPKHAINFTAGVQATSHLYISGLVRSISKREEFVYGSKPVTLDSYTTIDLYTEYTFSGLFKAFVDLRNITNKEYFDIRGYNTRKFNFTAGLNFKL
jgi:vitamin B12 transporter